VAANDVTTDVLWGVGGILFALAALAAGMYGFRQAFDYQLRGPSLVISLLGITVRTVAIPDINDVEVVPFSSLIPLSRQFRWDLLISHKLCGYSRQLLAIGTRSGLIKKVILSPKDAGGLAHSLKSAASAR